MKKLIIFLPVVALFAFEISSQYNEGKKLPSVKIKDVDGNLVNTAEVSNNGNPIVLFFWVSNCKTCNSELNIIAEEYRAWQEETGVKIIVVSVDDQKTAGSVAVMANAADWEFEIWMDPNGEFKRALGVNYTPHTFLLDGEGTIVYSHNNFFPGDEEVLYDKIVEVSYKYNAVSK